MNPILKMAALIISTVTFRKNLPHVSWSKPVKKEILNNIFLSFYYLKKVISIYFKLYSYFYLFLNILQL